MQEEARLLFNGLMARFFVLHSINLKNNKMNTIKHLTLRTLIICLGITMATSCTNDSPSQDSKEHAEEMNEEKFGKEGEKDADRVIELYGANLYELKVSEEAVNKASTADVKQLASMMVKAHGKMTADLQQLATRKGITLPGELTNDQLRDMDNLKDKTGLDYDKEYLDQMKNKHEDSIDKLEKTSEKSEDAEIKQWASQSVPEVRSHLDMIEATKSTVKDKKKDTRTMDNKSNKTGSDRS